MPSTASPTMAQILSSTTSSSTKPSTTSPTMAQTISSTASPTLAQTLSSDNSSKPPKPKPEPKPWLNLTGPRARAKMALAKGLKSANWPVAKRGTIFWLRMREMEEEQQRKNEKEPGAGYAFGNATSWEDIMRRDAEEERLRLKWERGEMGDGEEGEGEGEEDGGDGEMEGKRGTGKEKEMVWRWLFIEHGDEE